MKAILNRSLHDTPPPGATRRRVWCAPVVASHSVVVLTATRVYLCPLGTVPDASAIEAINTGADPEPLLGNSCLVLECHWIQRVVAELFTDTLTFEMAHQSQTPARITITFAAAEAADELFMGLVKRFNESGRLISDKDDPIALARPTLGVMAGIALSTATLSMTINAIHDLQGSATGVDFNTPWIAAIGWMDWRVVCALGGVLLAIVQVWLYRQFTRPPARLELVRN